MVSVLEQVLINAKRQNWVPSRLLRRQSHEADSSNISDTREFIQEYLKSRMTTRRRGWTGWTVGSGTGKNYFLLEELLNTADIMSTRNWDVAQNCLRIYTYHGQNGRNANIPRVRRIRARTLQVGQISYCTSLTKISQSLLIVYISISTEEAASLVCCDALSCVRSRWRGR